jgi:hypothetical protein
VKVGGLNFSLAGALGALDKHQTTSGTYYGVNGNTNVAAGQPMQPGFYTDATHAAAGRVHGVTLDGAHYSDIGSLDPVVAQPSNEWDNNWAEPALSSDGWSPAQPLSVESVTTGRAFTDTVLAQLGQYNGQTGGQRLYDGMSVGVYYSSSPDWTSPQITYVGDRMDLAHRVTVIKVDAQDLSGILKAVVTYTKGDNQWHSQDLTYDEGTGKWTGEIPAISNVLYFVQAVDKAGNVGVADNKGRYYQLPGSSVYLPVIVRKP